MATDDDDDTYEGLEEAAAVLNRIATIAVSLYAKAADIPEHKAWKIVLERAETECLPD